MSYCQSNLKGHRLERVGLDTVGVVAPDRVLSLNFRDISGETMFGDMDTC